MEIHWAAEHGLKGILFPAIPPDADVPKLWSDEYDPIWRACEETGLSVNQHGGAGVPDYSTAKIKNFLMIMEVPFANRSLCVILSGVFERFPNLQFVMTEQRTGWVPETLKKMDGVWWAFNNGGVGELRMDGNSLERSPSSYFDTNCTMGASFPSRDEAEAIKELGVGNVMWGSDYPHRGDLPDSVASLRHVFHDWGPLTSTSSSAAPRPSSTASTSSRWLRWSSARRSMRSPRPRRDSRQPVDGVRSPSLRP